MGQDFYAEGHAPSSCARALQVSPSYRSCVTHATVFFFPFFLGGEGKGREGRKRKRKLLVISRLVRFEYCYRCAAIERTMRMCAAARCEFAQVAAFQREESRMIEKEVRWENLSDLDVD